MQSGHGGKQSRKWELAIAALLAEPTVEAAARAAGISRNRLLHWLHQEDFQRSYRAARLAVLEQTVTALVRASQQAVDVLIAALAAPRDSDKIRAAGTILIHAQR